ncbi:GTP cyclohydrolase [Bacillus xiamenensis]|uniref:GTP cyclohydrolase II n=1 Tax=Bacillus xiamenensis TaxID=1178537 RepID=A0ABT4EZJ5_9BACI|nr:MULTISPECIES: GTP cyclohydrolase II [Bacillus]MBG9910152.1 GTP cyclohydrolase [Bacillus xiamenensis]MCY9575221.1 GTP cyclohydrolase II [Bacillus xiamenensis]QGX64289.1 GTP cyclohydrolase II RibA [Bacillus sp. ms-22]
MDKHTEHKTAILKDKIKRVQQEDGYIYITGPIKLPVNLDGRTVMFNWYSWLKDDGKEPLSDEDLIESLSSRELADHQQSSVLVYGDFEQADEALIRMHSICHTGDIFGSKRCDCGFQLKQSMRMIEDNGAGALFYLANHEGRGIGLFSKAMAYILQENGYDTVEANEALGFEDDTRQYEEAIAVLQTLRTKPVRLITNNPKKTDAISHAGLSLSGRIPLWGDVSEFNEKYLQTKINRSGHMKADQEVRTIATS